MRLELFGVIALTTVVATACNSDDTTTSLGQDGTGGDLSGMGGSITGTGGSITGTGGTPNGTSGVPNGTSGAGGSQTGAGGNQPGAGGNQPGAGGNQPGGDGGPNNTCPATAPNNGDACTAFMQCNYGNNACTCRRTGGRGSARAWRCGTAPDGGFPQPPDGGFQPTTCTGASSCTNGDVCCQFTFGGRGGVDAGTIAICTPATRCRGTQLP